MKDYKIERVNEYDMVNDVDSKSSVGSITEFSETSSVNI
jgi:hypothetical protein